MHKPAGNLTFGKRFTPQSTFRALLADVAFEGKLA